eukprot:scaffold181651_cov26-Tisochrysis_lutea.AAC.2
MLYCTSPIPVASVAKAMAGPLSHFQQQQQQQQQHDGRRHSVFLGRWTIKGSKVGRKERAEQKRKEGAVKERIGREKNIIKGSKLDHLHRKGKVRGPVIDAPPSRAGAVNLLCVLDGQGEEGRQWWMQYYAVQ